MKKAIAILVTLSTLAAFTACRNDFLNPATSTDAKATVTDAVMTSTTEPETSEMPTTEPETTLYSSVETSAATNPASINRPTEKITYTEEKGIPITNAYFSLSLPASWNEHFLCRTSLTNKSNISVEFFEISSNEAGLGGKLFSINLIPHGEEFLAANFEQLHVLQTGALEYDLYIEFPSDVQYTAETEQQYRTMYEQIDDIAKTLTPAVGCKFK